VLGISVGVVAGMLTGSPKAGASLGVLVGMFNGSLIPGIPGGTFGSSGGEGGGSGMSGEGSPVILVLLRSCKRNQLIKA
jgi:hypothetical protein